jgi:hypothetical protein
MTTICLPSDEPAVYFPCPIYLQFPKIT